MLIDFSHTIRFVIKIVPVAFAILMLQAGPAAARAESGDIVALDRPVGDTQRLTVTIWNDTGGEGEGAALYVTVREVPWETPIEAACTPTMAQNQDARIADATPVGPAPYEVGRSVVLPLGAFAVCIYGGPKGSVHLADVGLRSSAVVGQRYRGFRGDVRCPDAHDTSNIPAPARSPLRHAHAHNDNLHRHPLFDALSHRFSSVEADVWLTSGQLAVGHDRNTVFYPQCTPQSQ